MSQEEELTSFNSNTATSGKKLGQPMCWAPWGEDYLGGKDGC